MQIKDVEKLTGLTAKSIRYYESMGLLSVKRNEENDYRYYTEDNVYQLKKIKLLRYLGFSIQEICNLSDAKAEDMKEALETRAESLSKDSLEYDMKIEMCLSLSRDFGQDRKVIDEYNDAIGFIKSDEIESLKDEILDISCPSIWLTIIESMIFLGPILWLFFRIIIKQWDMLIITGIFAIMSSVILTLMWKDYFYKRKHYKDRVAKKNRSDVHIIPVILITIVATIAAACAYGNLQQTLFAPSGWLFCEMDQRLDILLIFCIMFPIIWLLIWAGAKIRKQHVDFNIRIKYKAVIIVAWLICMYICFTSINFVTKDAILHYSPICPQGHSYSFSEVKKVEACFGSKNFTLFDYERKGNFSYTVYVDDKKMIFDGPSTNEEIGRYDDTYLELEEFDAALMKLGIPKYGDDTYSSACDFDQRYVNRFLRIIHNK